MKRTILLIALCAAMISPATSQVGGIGFKGGVNFSNFNTGASGMTRLHLGAYYNYMVSDQFAIQPELVYSQMGAKYATSIPFLGTLDMKYKINYIQIPVMFKLYIPNAEGLNLHAGPVIGLKINSNAVIEGAAAGAAYELPTKGLDFLFAIGAGYELESGLNFALRYNLGLTEVWDQGGKNRLFQISLGYTLPQ